VQLYLGYDHVIEGLAIFYDKNAENRGEQSSLGKENTSFASK